MQLRRHPRCRCTDGYECIPDNLTNSAALDCKPKEAILSKTFIGVVYPRPKPGLNGNFSLGPFGRFPRPATALPLRPIFTLLHAQNWRLHRKAFWSIPLARFCSPDDAPCVDDTETTQVEAVQATKGSSVISQSWSTRITLCKCQLMRPGLDSTMAEIIKAPL